MATPKQEYTRALRDVNRRFATLEKDTIKQMAVFLRQFQERLQLRLTSSTTIEAAKIEEMIAAVNQLVAGYEAQMLGLSNGAIRSSATLGALSVVDPLQAAGLASGMYTPSPAQINTLLDFSADLIKGLTGDMLKNINREIRLAVLAERSTIDAMKNITDLLGTSRRGKQVAKGVSYDAERILRTETGRAFSLSTQSQLEATAKQVPELQKQWLSTGDRRTRPCHLLAHGQVVGWDKPFNICGELLMYPKDPAGSAATTINCLLPGNEVLAPGLIAASRAWYSGPAFELTIVTGDKLTVTPNHPILTPAGWKPAHLIKEGDYVISCLAGKEIARTIDPDNDHVPTPIEEVWRSLFVMGGSGKFVRGIMPQDFHGDGRFMNGNIDIVRANSQLWRDVKDTTTGEQAEEVAFRFRLVLQSALSGFSPFVQFLLRALHSAYGIVRGGSQFEPLMAGHPLHPERIGFANSARFYSSLQQSLTESAPGNTSNGGEFLLRFSRLITTKQVVKIRNFDFSGHVYDLQTSEQLYISNGYVVHNCRCDHVAVHPEIGPLVTPLDARVEKERAAREKAVKGKAGQPAKPPVRQIVVPDFKNKKEAEQWFLDNLIDPKEIEHQAKYAARGYKPETVVSLRGLDMDSIQEIARTLADYRARGIPPVRRIISKNAADTWMARISNFGDLEFNTRYVKNLDTFKAAMDKAALEYSDEGRRLFQDVKENRHKLKPDTLKIFERDLPKMEEHFKYNRWHVDDTFPGLIRHEMGHHVDNRAMEILGIERDSEAGRQFRKEFREAMLEVGKSNYKYKLSEYPFSSYVYQHGEVWAESFSAYERGEFDSIHPAVLEFLKRLLS